VPLERAGQEPEDFPTGIPFFGFGSVPLQPIISENERLFRDLSAHRCAIIRSYPSQFVPQFVSLSFREIVSLTFAEQREEKIEASSPAK